MFDGPGVRSLEPVRRSGVAARITRSLRPAADPRIGVTMTMTTTVNEIAQGIYRLSTLVREMGPDGFTFNQFLVDDDEPLLFHTGHRSMFPSICEAIETVLPVSNLRWITFGHVESDECGAMNDFLTAAPSALVAHGALGCLVSLNEMADRSPRALADGEVIETG